MKSKILLTLLFSLLVKVSFGQEIRKTDIVKFKIKSITTLDESGNVINVKFYNSDGDLSKEGSLNDDKQIKIEKEFFYNESLQLAKKQTYNSIGEIHSVSKYYYNDKKQLFKEEYISGDDIEATTIFTYDINGNKITEKQKSGTMANYLTTFEYDDKNFLIKEDKSNNSIGKEERINYKYNDAGMIVEKKTLVYYFNTTITLKYIYNDAGRLIKLLEKSSNGVSSTRIFEYNERGLLTSDTWKSSISKTPHKTTYQINFD